MTEQLLKIGTELNLITAVSFTKTVIFQQDLLPLQATAVSRTKSPNSIKAIQIILKKHIRIGILSFYTPVFRWMRCLKMKNVSGRSALQVPPYDKKYLSTTDKTYNPSTGTWTPINGKTWFQASSDVVSYYLDPRNFLTKKVTFSNSKHCPMIKMHKLFPASNQC